MMSARVIFHDVRSTKSWTDDDVFRISSLGRVARCCSMAELEKIVWHCLQVVCSGVSEEQRLVSLSIAYLQVVGASV